MTNVDQFESVFRSAAKEAFEYRPIEFKSILVVTDRAEPDAQKFEDEVRSLLKVLGGELTWRHLAGDAYEGPEHLLQVVQERKPDLVCTYRNLHSKAWRYPYSLGEHVDVLTQHTGVPVLLTPHPDAERASEHAFERTQHVVGITNHLAGDHRLVNSAVRLTESGGTLHLVHVEDDADFERYMEAISKISTIDTDDAREKLTRQLLKEPEDYIEACRRELSEKKVPVSVEGKAVFGHRVAEINKVIAEYRTDLLVFNTVDQDQLAMHGLAYSLAVEIRQIPLLML